MTNSEQLHIDWTSVEVHEGSLRVGLTGEAPKGWQKDFEGVLALLGQSSDGWGEISLAKNAIKVTEVRQGAEGELRHLLESVLLQVNSDLRADQEKDDEKEQGERDPVKEADNAMAETFRSFGEAEEYEAEE